MKDNNGNPLDAVKNEATKHYLRVFEDKPMEEELSHLKNSKENVCNERIKMAKKVKTPQWTK